MKNSSQRKQKTAPTTSLSVKQALAYFDFSQPLPQPIDPALDPTIVQRVGETLLDGLEISLKGGDDATFVLCYRALHYCLGLNMEMQQLHFATGKGLALLMTAFQAAVMFNKIDLALRLFRAAMDSPEHPIRKGASAPWTMIIHAHVLWVKMQSDGAYASQWLQAVDIMIAELVERLAQQDPDALCPTTGGLFSLLPTLQGDDRLPGLQRLCDAMQARYTALIATSTAATPRSSSPQGRL